jgi:hypothetical protein
MTECDTQNIEVLTGLLLDEDRQHCNGQLSRHDRIMAARVMQTLTDDMRRLQREIVDQQMLIERLNARLDDTRPTVPDAVGYVPAREGGKDLRPPTRPVLAPPLPGPLFRTESARRKS